MADSRGRKTGSGHGADRELASRRSPPPGEGRERRAGEDHGFDQEPSVQEDWLGFASTHAPLRIWLAAIEYGPVLLALSQANVTKAFADQGGKVKAELPDGALAALALQAIATLHRVVRRAFQLSRDETAYVMDTFPIVCENEGPR